ncbi:MAG: phosphoribosylamine--glycine ligase [Candidatus Obscuribacterales bacterium]
MSDSKKTIMIVGGGGREHALAWKIASSPSVSRLYCAPGNGGTAALAGNENVPIAVSAFDEIADFALSKKVDLVVIGPDNPLADGIVDHLEQRGLKCFGPRAAAARLESSKAYAKEKMTEMGVATAGYGVFDNKSEALEYARKNKRARVVKADGLAFGKGVTVCDTIAEVETALAQIFDERAFGEAGDRVLVEDRLEGEELSLFLLCDGKSILELVPCQDHKRRFDKDAGPNTGGMGAYSPVPAYDRFRDAINNDIIEPIRLALTSGKLDYKGVLFVGILIEDGKPHTLEFNARFGDPETQAFLPRLKSDLVPALFACCDGTLDKIELEWDSRHSCCVVAAARSYPAGSSKGKLIETGSLDEDAILFQAGTALDGGALVTNGGRVLSVTGLGESIEAAARKAYDNLTRIKFEDMDYRRDIAGRVIARCQSK